MTILSIVVPIFNGAQHLQPFMASVEPYLATGDVELILINDGSTDITGTLLDAAAATHRAVRVLHLANGGQGRAKNTGALTATGDYLWFVDVDDVFEEQDAEPLLEVLRRGNHEVVLTGYRRIDVETLKELDRYTPSLFAGTDGRAQLDRLESAGHSAWNKIISSDLFHAPGMSFLEGVIHEDMAVVPLWISRASSVHFDPCIRYRYGVRVSSSINGNFTRGGDLLVALNHLAEHGSSDPARVGRSISKEVFFYTLPRWCDGISKGSVPLSEYRLYHAKLMSLVRELPSSFRDRRVQGFSALSRGYMSLVERGFWFLPYAVFQLRRVLVELRSKRAST